MVTGGNEIIEGEDVCMLAKQFTFVMFNSL